MLCRRTLYFYLLMFKGMFYMYFPLDYPMLQFQLPGGILVIFLVSYLQLCFSEKRR